MYPKFLIYGAIASSCIDVVLGLNLQFSRRAATAQSSPFSPGFRLLGSSAGAADVNSTLTIENIMDIRYTANITINGKVICVALDTGSTDIWASPPGGLGSFNDIGIPIKLAYGDGSYGVSGTVGVSSFNFGNYNVDRQAFLAVNKVSGISSLTDLGIHGLFGLSFDIGSASPINAAITAKYGQQATWGQSVLQNIFDQQPDQPNFIAIDLSRTGDLEDTSEGSFGIAEYDQRFTAVANAPKLAQFPKGGSRWTTLLEGINVNGTALPMKSTITGVPASTMLALFDTGTPTVVVPTYLLDAVYSKIPGGVPYDQSNTSRVWIIPCNTTTSVSFSFGGQEFYVHPLDLTNIVNDLSLGNKTYSACVSAFVGADGEGGSEFEILLGDSFLRNVYSVYDFNEHQASGTVGGPYIQLLGKTDPTAAAAEVAAMRSKTMSTIPPEVDTTTLHKLLLASEAVSTGTKPTITAGQPTAAGDSQGGRTLLTVPGGVAVVILLALYLLVTLGVAVFAIVRYVHWGKKPHDWTLKNGPYVPVRLYEDSGINKLHHG